MSSKFFVKMIGTKKKLESKELVSKPDQSFYQKPINKFIQFKTQISFGNQEHWEILANN
jgi:hypothetical protein